MSVLEKFHDFKKLLSSVNDYLSDEVDINTLNNDETLNNLMRYPQLIARLGDARQLPLAVIEKIRRHEWPAAILHRYPKFAAQVRVEQPKATKREVKNAPLIPVEESPANFHDVYQLRRYTKAYPDKLLECIKTSEQAGFKLFENGYHLARLTATNPEFIEIIFSRPQYLSLIENEAQWLCLLQSHPYCLEFIFNNGINLPFDFKIVLHAIQSEAQCSSLLDSCPQISKYISNTDMLLDWCYRFPVIADRLLCQPHLRVMIDTNEAIVNLLRRCPERAKQFMADRNITLADILADPEIFKPNDNEDAFQRIEIFKGLIKAYPAHRRQILDAIVQHDFFSAEDYYYLTLYLFGKDPQSQDAEYLLFTKGLVRFYITGSANFRFVSSDIIMIVKHCPELFSKLCEEFPAFKNDFKPNAGQLAEIVNHVPQRINEILSNPQWTKQLNSPTELCNFLHQCMHARKTLKLPQVTAGITADQALAKVIKVLPQYADDLLAIPRLSQLIKRGSKVHQECADAMFRQLAVHDNYDFMVECEVNDHWVKEKWHKYVSLANVRNVLNQSPKVIAKYLHSAQLYNLLTSCRGLNGVYNSYSRNDTIATRLIGFSDDAIAEILKDSRVVRELLKLGNFKVFYRNYPSHARQLLKNDAASEAISKYTIPETLLLLNEMKEHFEEVVALPWIRIKFQANFKLTANHIQQYPELSGKLAAKFGYKISKDMVLNNARSSTELLRRFQAFPHTLEAVLDHLACFSIKQLSQIMCLTNDLMFLNCIIEIYNAGAPMSGQQWLQLQSCLEQDKSPQARYVLGLMLSGELGSEGLSECQLAHFPRSFQQYQCQQTQLILRSMHAFRHAAENPKLHKDAMFKIWELYNAHKKLHPIIEKTYWKYYQELGCRYRVSDFFEQYHQFAQTSELPPMHILISYHSG